MPFRVRRRSSSVTENEESRKSHYNTMDGVKDFDRKKLIPYNIGGYQ